MSQAARQRKLLESYPNGFMTRRLNNSGHISWHKDRAFISEVFRFEELGFELVAEGFYKVSSVRSRSENSTLKPCDSGRCTYPDDLEKAREDRPASVIPNFDVVFIFRSA